MPRLPNQQRQRRNHIDDGRHQHTHQHTRPVARERTVTFLIPQEELSPVPSFGYPVPVVESRRRAVPRRTGEPSSASSSSTFPRTGASTRTYGNDLGSGLVAPNAPRMVPLPLPVPAHDQHGTWTPHAHNHGPSNSGSTSTLSGSTRRQPPQQEPAGYSETALPPIPHRIILDDTLTGLRWDVRDRATHARDRHGHKLDLDRASGLPSRIKLAVIEFESENRDSEHPARRLVKRWGPIVVNNQFRAITVGDILGSVSGYLRETIRAGELEELVRTQEDRERLDEAWHARHGNRFHRVPETYRRVDVLEGEVCFRDMRLDWVGEWACHLRLSLMKY